VRHGGRSPRSILPTKARMALPARDDHHADRLAVCTENLNPDVVVMKSTKDRV
jgi:hypothetical protein